MEVYVLTDINNPSTYFLFPNLISVIEFLPAYKWKMDWAIRKWVLKNRQFELIETMHCTRDPQSLHGIEWW